MTADFDVCEVDLDMQVSFLNATPFRFEDSVGLSKAVPTSTSLSV